MTPKEKEKEELKRKLRESLKIWLAIGILTYAVANVVQYVRYRILETKEINTPKQLILWDTQTGCPYVKETNGNLRFIENSDGTSPCRK